MNTVLSKLLIPTTQTLRFLKREKRGQDSFHKYG